ncbi:unnamed protein product [Miscanthus lutarioriparius]|uniref:Uncharacterized protein n=1 Tax=Miscanthus lutarioriparius TaxID=422564 RepID=A0A811PJ59_9POAL|nr:unnamed protein product [Miscanthus lutarioriparius]
MAHGENGEQAGTGPICVGLYQGSFRPQPTTDTKRSEAHVPLVSYTDGEKEMRGVGGPLLTIGDLLSDLAVDGGDDPLIGVGDASAPSSPSAAQQSRKADPSDLSRLFEEHYNNLMKALQEKDPSWPSLMLKKVKALEDVLERGDHAVAEIVEALQRSGLAKDRHGSQSKTASK